MKTLVVAIKNIDSMSPCLNMLPPCFKFTVDGETYKIVIHRAPEIFTANAELQCNFDIMVDIHIKEEPNRDIKELLGSSYVSLCRESKFYQNTVMSREIKRNGYYLQVPEMYGKPLTSSTDNKYNTAPLIGNTRGDFWVIKGNYGARGVGQALVPGTSISDFINSAKALSVKDLRARYPLVKLGTVDNEDDYLFSCCGSELVIEKYVKDIVREYRLLYVNGRIISVVERGKVSSDKQFAS